MARTHECSHTEQHIICPVCDDEGNAHEPISEIEATVTFTAQFESICGNCPDPIYEGDVATLVVYDDDNKTAMHHECAGRAVKEAV